MPIYPIKSMVLLC